jgi:hypothetical protein
MDASLPLEVLGDIAVLRPRGRVALAQLIPRVAAAIESARSRGLRKLLLDTLALEGLESPGIGTRFFLSRQWAVAAAGAVRVAVVASPRMLDPQKFGVVVARNFGTTAEAFTSVAEALAWLQDSP